MGRQRVTVRVPSTTANLGPGFDCMGLALELATLLTAEVAEESGLRYEGEGANELSLGEDNLVLRALRLYGDATGQRLPPLRVSVRNEVPLGRGLGSSAAAVVATLVAANCLCREPLDSAALLRLAVRLEGHPDNVAAAIFGGCVIVVATQDGYLHAQVPLPDSLRAVLFVPAFAMPTQEARRILSPQVSRSAAIFNIGRAALLSLALSTGRLELLRIATEDALHQPARQSLFPAMPALFQAALEAGALGVFLSGSGSTVLALVLDDGAAVAQGLERCARDRGLSGRIVHTRPSLAGATVVEEA